MIDFVFYIFLSTTISENLQQSASPPLNPKPYEMWQDPISDHKFIWMQSECFKMGSRDSGVTKFLHEKPLHTVCCDGFWIGKHEVTNKQYRKYEPKHNSGMMEGNPLNEDAQPAVYVTWNDAKAYAEWLTKQSKGKYLVRLPTEAEWELSCRAGTETERYWGEKEDEACKYANVADNLQQLNTSNYHHCTDNFVSSSPVGSFIPNTAGLHDMLGNAWEWCEDHYSWRAYRQHEERNPVYREVEDGMDYRVIRGGSYLSEPYSIRCARRTFARPDSKYNVLGFRLVLTPTK